MEWFVTTITARQVYDLIVKMGTYNKFEGGFVALTAKGKTYATNHGADGGFFFYDGEYNKLTAEEAFKRISH